MTKAEIINETVEFYSADVNRRAITNRTCHYSIKILDDEERNCSVGRCMTPEALSEYGNQIMSVYALNKESSLDDLLQFKYQGYHVSFWRDLQLLHDRELNWEQNGLTETGKSLVIQLRETYKH